MSARQLLVTVPTALAAMAGAITGVGARGADDAFLTRQENPTRVSVDAVERLILSAPDPVPPHESGGTRSRCRASGRRELRNPWRCDVAYRSRSRATYRVTIRPDGSYRARYLSVISPDGTRSDGGTATASGCCLKLPGTG